MIQQESGDQEKMAGGLGSQPEGAVGGGSAVSGGSGGEFAERGAGTLGALIRRARGRAGITLEEAARRVGCAKSHLSMIENNPRGAGASREVLVRLEEVLGMGRGELVRAAHWYGAPGEVKGEVARWKAAQRAAREIAKLGGVGGLDQAFKSGRLNGLIDELDPTGERRGAGSDEKSGGEKAGEVKRKRDGAGEPGHHGGRGAERGVMPIALPVEVPVINSVAAGYPTEFTDLGYPARVADSYIRTPDLCDADAFAARVVGDSMLPEYREGDVVIFSPLRGVKSGMDCFVRLEPDQETTFKRVFFEDEGGAAFEENSGTVRGAGAEGALEIGGAAARAQAAKVWIRLQPLNPKYGARRVAREGVAGLYAAVSVMRRI
ncbi:hypothetical protein BH11PLA1_BH11PLA1_21550 [soil metagenome]